MCVTFQLLDHCRVNGNVSLVIEAEWKFSRSEQCFDLFLLIYNTESTIFFSRYRSSKQQEAHEPSVNSNTTLLSYELRLLGGTERRRNSPRVSTCLSWCFCWSPPSRTIHSDSVSLCLALELCMPLLHCTALHVSPPVQSCSTSPAVLLYFQVFNNRFNVHVSAGALVTPPTHTFGRFTEGSLSCFPSNPTEVTIDNRCQASTGVFHYPENEKSLWFALNAAYVNNSPKISIL